MWFGTDNGLARFDGRRVQNFTLGDGDSNRILAMKTDPHGRIWIGTQKARLFLAKSGRDHIGDRECRRTVDVHR